jgi:hypothetical protein
VSPPKWYCPRGHLVKWLRGTRVELCGLFQVSGAAMHRGVTDGASLSLRCAAMLAQNSGRSLCEPRRYSSMPDWLSQRAKEERAKQLCALDFPKRASMLMPGFDVQPRRAVAVPDTGPLLGILHDPTALFAGSQNLPLQAKKCGFKPFRASKKLDVAATCVTFPRASAGARDPTRAVGPASRCATHLIWTMLHGYASHQSQQVSAVAPFCMPPSLARTSHER